MVICYGYTLWGSRHRSDIPVFLVQTIPMNLWNRKSCALLSFTISEFHLHCTKRNLPYLICAGCIYFVSHSCYFYVILCDVTILQCFTYSYLCMLLIVYSIRFFVRRSSDSNHACNYVRDLEVPDILSAIRNFRTRMSEKGAAEPGWRICPGFVRPRHLSQNVWYFLIPDTCTSVIAVRWSSTKNKLSPHFCSLYPTPPNPASNWHPLQIILR